MFKMVQKYVTDGPRGDTIDRDIGTLQIKQWTIPKYKMTFVYKQSSSFLVLSIMQKKHYDPCH